MSTTKLLVRGAALGAATVGFVAVTFPDSAIGRSARRLGDRLTRDIRYAVASAPGLRYRLAGRRPDPNVSDAILGDRIRSTIGPLEKRLDVPHVHVMVQDHFAILHGDVTDIGAAMKIEDAVLRVSGVDGVESHLHPALGRGDTRPSTGRTEAAPSDAYGALLEAAREAGALDPRAAVHAVLCGFLDRLPPTERSHVDAHLPDDVRALVGPPRRYGRPHRARTVPQLVAAVVAEGGIEASRAEDITLVVLDALRRIVPEEARDIGAVLPEDLRELWGNAAAR